MPPDPAQPRRRPGRIPTSCAECRRLKLKCDRNIPCEKCVSRGCGQICPDGVTHRHGKRLVLANTKELHEEIDQLRSRVRNLEDALRSIQETVSRSPHPLLVPELLQIKNGTIRNHDHGNLPNGNKDKPPNPSDLPTAISTLEEGREDNYDDADFIDTFGTLSIGAHGEFNFLGKSARSEFLLRVKPSHLSGRHAPDPLYPRISTKISASGCCSKEINRPVADEVFSHLPPLSECIILAELYLEHGRYFYVPIPREQLFDEIMANVYRAGATDDSESLHAISLLFAILALGALFDPKRTPYNVESLEYLHLARTAYGLVYEKTTLLGVQALSHICVYMELNNAESEVSHTLWTWLGHSSHLAQSLGLHLNSARWQLAEEIAQRRSLTFWALFVFDTWTSFYFGRPPSMSLAYIDCPLPVGYQSVTGENGEKEIGYHTWTFQYAKFMHKVMAIAFGSKTPSYSTILALDREIRDFPVPSHLRLYSKEGECQDNAVYIQRWHVLCAKEYTLLHLHRGYFAQAFHELPSNIGKHRYITSVMATYRSAWRIGQSMRCAWRTVNDFVIRSSIYWSQALTAGLVMCIIATNAPNSQIGVPALDELDLLAALFEMAAPTCRAAAHSQSTMKRLRDKGHEAVGRHPTSAEHSDPLPSHELERLGGRTRLVSMTSQEARSGESSLGGGPQDRPPSPPVQQASSSANPVNMPSFDYVRPMMILPPEEMQPPIIQGFESSLDAIFKQLTGSKQAEGSSSVGQTSDIYGLPQSQNKQHQQPQQHRPMPHHPQQNSTSNLAGVNTNQNSSPESYFSSSTSDLYPPVLVHSFPDFPVFQDHTFPSMRFENGAIAHGGGGGLVPHQQQQHHPQQNANTPPTTSTPAFLDETWQHFVEQLGF